MTNEIKEILERLKIKSDRYNHHLKYNMSYENKDEDYEAHLLLDCITNLQERNEKAIEYLNNFDFQYLKERNEYALANILKAILNILQGSDKDVN